MEVVISRVLVPMDDSDSAAEALKYALEVHADAEITVLHVVGGGSTMMGEAAKIAIADDVEDAAREDAESVLKRARSIADDYEVGIETAIAIGDPATNVIEAAEDFDAVVIGAHSGTLSERLFGKDVTRTVFRRSSVPVTIVR